MRVLLLDPDARLDTSAVRQLAAGVGLIPLALADLPTAPEKAEGVLFYGELPGPEQARELDALLEDADAPLDLVLESANDPRPLEQRLSEPLEGDSPLAAHYREQGLLHRVWSDATDDALAAALAFALKDTLRARHPEDETPFPPAVSPRVEEAVAPQEPEPADEEIEAKSAPEEPPADTGEDSVPAWRRSAEQRGRIKRRSPTAGGRAGRGWKPRS